MATTRTVDFLPEIFRTSTNQQFLSATLDQLIQEPAYQRTQGYVGRTIGAGVNADDKYVVETDKVRRDYQLEPGVVVVKPESNTVSDAITYPGIKDALALQGGIVNNDSRLFTSDYYAWDPFVDFDKFVNFSRYYWLPGGPDPVDVGATAFPTTDDFTVTRDNGVYTFSGKAGDNPVITLVRGGNYTFDVAQNDKETVNFRVTNRTDRSYVIDYKTNPVLTLARGNTYVFNLSLNGNHPLWIKSEAGIGLENTYSSGVTNNGVSSGQIVFVVPQDAPDTLHYSSQFDTNMSGRINVINATITAGPGFFIQTNPGVAGVLPTSANISSRDVLGVVNNGEDLGTVTFKVPLSTAQNFYYTLTRIAAVDLATNLRFDQINNIFLDPFLAEHTSIDGLTELDGKTIVFLTTNTDDDTNGWRNNSQFDADGYDLNTVTFDQSTVIPTALRSSVWRIRYVTTNGSTFMQLDRVVSVAAMEKFSILNGTIYANVEFYKNAEAFFEQIPLLSAIKNTLYYQDGTDPEIFGRIHLIDQDNNDELDISDIIGAKNFTAPNEVKFTNGLKVIFRGTVVPASYVNNTYYVEGVGSSIQLLPTTDFVTPEPYTESDSVPYDTLGYDVGNYDANLNAPTTPDYLTINRASGDRNAWSRGNRWFHIEVIEATASYNNQTPLLDNDFRAKRPIMEFRAGMRLVNYGTEAKLPVDIIDFAATDALSDINGTLGYGVDGFTFIEGTRVIFANDRDVSVRNKIYTVEFISPDTVAPLILEPIINLVPSADSAVLVDQVVLCLSGLTLQGKVFYFDGVEWKSAQQKTTVNQAPLFNAYDSTGTSFGDVSKYLSSNFAGTKLFSYALGTGTDDPVLDFPLKYLSLENIGDIVFDNNLYNDTFSYVGDNTGKTGKVGNGFVREYSNRTTYTQRIGWQKGITKSQSRQQFQFTYDGGPIQFDILANNNSEIPAISIFIESQFVPPSDYTVTRYTNTTEIRFNETYTTGAIIEATVLSNQVSKKGFYQVTSNLENNPFNTNSATFTLGTVRSHYQTIGQNLLALVGLVNGANNIRDLGNIIPYGKQILQQSSPLTLAGYFLRDPGYEIFSAIDFNSKEYIKFKNQLLDMSVTNDYTNATTADIVTQAIIEMTSGKSDINSFYWSDMLPAGAVYTETTTTYTAISDPIFDLSRTYDFTTSNYHGVLVYLNDDLLTIGYDYTVATDGPRLTISAALAVGDVIVIREYASTLGSFVPNTPTKLGLYPAFKPQKYLDVNAVSPKLVIRGHDGSITNTFGDIRDDVLLEFERRIFNNLKINSAIPLLATDVIPGQFRDTGYTQSEITQILSKDFLTWVGNNRLDFKTQEYINNNEFTWNYYSASNKLSSSNTVQQWPEQQPRLLGGWRGIYRYFYDTQTPNLTPWEMLGFSQEPTWWEDRYGPAPYTKDNLVLWEDLQTGTVADPAGYYVKSSYIRPGLTETIPVDGEGNLASPMASTVGVWNQYAFRKSWVVGDGGPVEASWWNSSSYPFSVMRLLALTRPAEFFGLFVDRDLYKLDSTLDQYLYDSRYRLDAKNLTLYGSGTSRASYINWIIDYNQQKGVSSSSALASSLSFLDVRLCYRFGAFTDKEYLKVFTEKSSPNSLNSSLLLPDESFKILLYKNQPASEINYSAVLVQKTNTGWSVAGFSQTRPYFDFLAAAPGATDTLTVGKLTVPIPIKYSNLTSRISYGHEFSNVAGLVDFLLGHGAHLQLQGMTFTSMENGLVMDWKQMATEFMYWSQQNWEINSIISLNPGAVSFTASKAGFIIDNAISDSFENQLLDQNARVISPKELVITRDKNEFKLTTTGNRAISYLNLKYTSYEHLMILDNTSIFSDLIYDPATGSRQSRITIAGIISSNWNGSVNAPGFILLEDNVTAWESRRRYSKGDIVLFKNTYWSATKIVQPSQTFDFDDWTLSDYARINKGLLPNLATKADQLANTYNIHSGNLDSLNDLLSFGLIGFKPRQYMVDLNLDDVSQVNVYQQFLATKGTIGGAELFKNANLNKEVAEYDIFENWAIRRGAYGATANRSYFELQLNEDLLSSNPALIQVVVPQESSTADQTVLLSNLWKQSYKIPSTDILPTFVPDITDVVLPSAGYVNVDDVDISVFSLATPKGIADKLNDIGTGTVIWAAKKNNYDWDIYRTLKIPGTIVEVRNNLDGSGLVTFSTGHGRSKDDLIIIRYFNTQINGVYRVLAVTSPTALVIAVSLLNSASAQTKIQGNGLGFYLSTMRVSEPSAAADLPYAMDLRPEAKIWIDNNGSGLWTVLEKHDAFTQSTLAQPTVVEGDKFGTSISQSANNLVALVGSPGLSSDTGGVYLYLRDPNNALVTNVPITLPATGVAGYGSSVALGNNTWAVVGASASSSNMGLASVLYRIPGNNQVEQRQLLTAPDQNFGTTKFGHAVAMSENERWMYISAPVANQVYAYGRVDIQEQQVKYTTGVATTIFNYSDNIVILDNNQLSVVLANQLLTLGVDYTVTATSVVLTAIPVSELLLTITRKTSQTFDGDGSTEVFALDPYLYTATNIYAFTVVVDGVLQRPKLDYDFDSLDSAIEDIELVFNTAPAAGTKNILVSTGHYFQFISTLPTSGLGLAASAQFGHSLSTTADGRQISVGAPGDDTSNGDVYTFDRNAIRYIISNTAQLTYAIPSPTDPVAVILNGEFLTNSAQFSDGQFEVSGFTIILSNSVELAVGDVLEIETNTFVRLQSTVSDTPVAASDFGGAVDISTNSSNLYVGSPKYTITTAATVMIPDTGMVERYVNQAQVYGTITSTIANPTLDDGDTIRINNIVVEVPDGDDQNIAGLAAAINAANIPNATATTTADLTFVGDGITKIFDIGELYSVAESYTTVVYIDDVLQTTPGNYSYNNTTEQITFTTAPDNLSEILVESGRITIHVENYNALTSGGFTVLPGTVGSVYSDCGFEFWAHTQQIFSPLPTVGASFGTSLSINNDATTLVVGAPGGNVHELMTFDKDIVNDISTYFDDYSTIFSDTTVQSGVVYTYDYLVALDESATNSGKFIFGQQVYDSNKFPLDAFGTSVNYTSNLLLVGAPNYDAGDSSVNYGQVAQFVNEGGLKSWQPLRTQYPSVNVNLLNTASIYNRLDNSTQTYLDFFDPLQGKILGAARQNIDYIGAVDPALYNVGTVKNNGNTWGTAQEGQIWWDTNNVRFMDPNQNDIEYAAKHWGQIFPGSSVDVCQWTASAVPPAQYPGPGIPLSVSSFSIQSQLNSAGGFTSIYYFWVLGINTVSTRAGKTLSPLAIALYIANPRSSGIPYLAAIDAGTIALYNSSDFISVQDSILHVEYDRVANTDNIHIEYELIAEGKDTAFLSDNIYRKLQDSFCGVNEAGAQVPDPLLVASEQIGVLYRPRQTMFVDRFTALKNYLSYVNRVMLAFPVTENRKLSLLNSQELYPTQSSGAWDKQVATIEELYYQSLNAKPFGYKYLVTSDTTHNGFWAIYEISHTVPVGGRQLNLIRVQTYDTRKYWQTADWYATGYTSKTRAVIEVAIYSTLATLTTTQAPVGSVAKVSANAQGKFELYVRTTTTEWNRVGLEDGTLQINSTIWDYTIGRFGFDSEVFDIQYLDQEPVLETRKIIQAINQEIFVDELLIERNRALTLMFNYILSETAAPDWLFKTSLIDAEHKLRELIPYQLYRKDNQSFVLDYIKEVKPYHVQLREYHLVYDGADTYAGALSDFDLPAYFNTSIEVKKFTTPALLPYTHAQNFTQSIDSDLESTDTVWSESPWREWYNNYLLVVESVTVTNGGSGYTEPPVITVSGTADEAAILEAIINSAGEVVAVTVTSPGVGYSTTAVLTLSGGNGTGATITAVMGNGLVRQFTTRIKYDRYEYSSIIVDWEANISYDNGTLVRYLDQVWEADSGDSEAVLNSVFDPDEWIKVSADTLSGVDRTMGFYLPGTTESGLDLALLIDGIDYPGVQVTAPRFNQNSGFDVGNYDVNVYDNIAFGPEGLPTYDPGILDAEYRSSYLDSALGTRTTDINVDGGEFIGLFESHAPEELIPGAIFDTLDLRVYTRPGSDWTGDGHGFALKTYSFEFVTAEPTVSFADMLRFPVSLTATNQTTQVDLNLGTDYTVNWVDQTVTILTLHVTAGDSVIITMYDIGGGNQLLRENHNGADVGNTLVIDVDYDEIQELAIFVNGEITTGFTFASYNTRFTRIQFSVTYSATDAITVVAIGETLSQDGSTYENYSWSTPRTQYITSNGALTYTLTSNLANSNPDNMIVTVNGVRARQSSCIEYLGDGSSEFLLPERLGFSQALISDNEVRVYLDEVLQAYGIDYVLEPYDPSSGHGLRRAIQFTIEPAIGIQILICVTTNSQCVVSGNQLIFNPVYGITPIAGDIIAVTTWNDTRQQRLLTQVFVGPDAGTQESVEDFDTLGYDTGDITGATGSFDFSSQTSVTLNNIYPARTVVNHSRLWVTLNGRHLYFGQDFTIVSNEIILISGLLGANDTVIITQFTESVVPEAMAFRIFQNMKGTKATYRITDQTTTTLTQELPALGTGNDMDIMHVDNAAALSEPNLSINLWGVLTINGERIFYRTRDTVNNTLSGLRRGVSGTAVAAHAAGAVVYDENVNNLLPKFYQDITLPGFDIGGYDISAADMPTTVGQSWYDLGDGTVSDGVALQEATNQAARFLRGQ